MSDHRANPTATPDETDADSFPASDPPASWAGPDRPRNTGAGAERRAMEDRDMGEDEPADDDAGAGG